MKKLSRTHPPSMTGPGLLSASAIPLAVIILWLDSREFFGASAWAASLACLGIALLWFLCFTLQLLRRGIMFVPFDPVRLRRQIPGVPFDTD